MTRNVERCEIYHMVERSLCHPLYKRSELEIDVTVYIMKYRCCITLSDHQWMPNGRASRAALRHGTERYHCRNVFQSDHVMSPHFQYRNPRS